MSMCKELQGSQKKETQQAFKGKQEEKKKKKNQPAKPPRLPTF